MKRTTLLGGFTGLAALVVAVLVLRMRWESPLNAAEIQLASGPPELETGAAQGAPSELPIPETRAAEVLVIETRRPAPGPSVRDFQTLYGSLSPGERSTQAKLVSERLQLAISARFDELHAQFDELRKRNEYSARVVKDGHTPFGKLNLHHRHGDVCSARPEIQGDGSIEFHVLEFCPNREPATCELFEELAWLQNRAR